MDENDSGSGPCGAREKEAILKNWDKAVKEDLENSLSFRHRIDTFRTLSQTTTTLLCHFPLHQADAISKVEDPEIRILVLLLADTTSEEAGMTNDCDDFLWSLFDKLFGTNSSFGQSLPRVFCDTKSVPEDVATYPLLSLNIPFDSLHHSGLDLGL